MKTFLLLIAFTFTFSLATFAKENHKINNMIFAPKSERPKNHNTRNVSLVDRIQKKNRQHKCKLYQRANHVRGNANFNWGRRPTGHWPFQFLQ